MKYEDLTQSQAILIATHYMDKEGDHALRISDEDYQERMNICFECDSCIEVLTPKDQIEYYDGKEKIHGCQECGCIIEDKCKDMFSKCPIEKWNQNFKDWDSKFYPNMLEYFKKNGIDPREW